MKLVAYVTALHALKEDDRLRGLKRRTGVDFASTDYLALASAPRIFGVGYVAKFAYLTTLPQRGDLLVLDLWCTQVFMKTRVPVAPSFK